MEKPVEGTDDGGWADIKLPSRGRGPLENEQPAIPKSLPHFDTLARPDVLFLDQLPYHMVIKMASKGIVVQGSHHPSLELLASYFTKWTRTMRNDVRKVRSFVHIVLIF